MRLRVHPLSSRILSRLRAAEAEETDPWFRDDLQIARLTVLHAACGDATICGSHVLASYEVLGLHPDKVWPAIQARRKALGPSLEEISRGAKKPPRSIKLLGGQKKPPQSVKLWCEKTNGARAVNSCADETLLRDNTISVPMATPSIAAAYRSSDDSGSAKERPFFTVAEIEKFFETCPEDILSRRFRHFLRHAWIAAGRPFGSEILFFKAVDNYRKACYYKSPTTARLNLRAAEKLGLLEVAHRDASGNCHHIWIRPRTATDKGLYRRVTTHRLPVGLLMKWRELHRGQKAEVTPIRKPAQPTEKPLPPAPAAPLPKREQPAANTPAKHDHRSPQRNPSSSSRKLTSREGPRLVNEMRRLMRGCSSFIEQQSGLEITLRPEDPRYRAPLSQEEALVAACANLGIPYEAAREHLKLIRPPAHEKEPT